MKQIVAAVLMMMFACNASGQNLIPDQKIGPTTANIYGWADGIYSEAGTDHDWDVTRFRIRPFVKYEKFELFNEFELAHADRTGSNWLQQAWLQYQATPELAMRGGRIFLAGANITPPPFILETVNYPRTLFPAYAYGAQMELSTDKWHLLADISGNSSRSFSGEGQMDRTEVSARLERRLDRITLAISGDFWKGTEIVAIDGEFKLNPVFIRWAVYGEENNTAKMGGYTLFMYRPTEWLELHTQFDFQDMPEPFGTTWTNGVRIWTPGSNLELTVDNESFFVGDRDRMNRANRWLTRLEFRF